MSRWLPILVALGVGLYQFQRWSRRVGPQRTGELLRRLGLGLLGVVVLLLLLRGGAVLALLPLTLPVLLPWLQRYLRRQAAGGTRREPGGADAGDDQRRSTVRTRFLEMTLDHHSGRMRGRVLSGRQAGRVLDDLGLPELLDLYREVQTDPQSASVLEAYLDRSHGEHWRSAAGDTHEEASAGAESADFSGQMDRRQALEILGLDEGATPEEIRKAHRRLMQKLHPDHGGSSFLAAQINRAKDYLLGR